MRLALAPAALKPYHLPMPVFLDDQPVDLTGQTLADLLESASNSIAENGRVVVEVHVDGQPVVGEQLEQQGDSPIGDAEVRLFSADPIELAASTLQQVRGRLDDASRLQSAAADLFQQDQPAEAIKNVADAVAAWQQTQQAVLQSAVLLGVELDGKSIDDKPVSDTITGLLEQLREMKELLAAGDTVALADSLAHEWPDTTQRWQQLIDEMVQWINDDEPS